MKKFLSLALCIALVLIGCSESDDNNREIVLSSNSQTSQTIYADETTGDSEGIRFTATAPWTATVTPVATKAEGGSSVDWLTLNAYSGGAGEFTLKLTLKENTTGADRKAKIEINCGKTTITITVEQKGTTEAGEIPAPTPDDKYYIAQIVEEGFLQDTEKVTSIITFEYDEQGRLVKTTTDGEYVNAFTYEGNKIIVDRHYPDEKESDVYQTIFTLNEEGYATTFDCRWDDSMGESGREQGSAEYDEDGYFITATVKRANQDDRVDKQEWTNGNLTKVHCDYYNTGSNNVAEFRYDNSQYVNNPKVNLDLTSLVSKTQWLSDYGSEFPIMTTIGHTGKRSKLMMTHEYDRSYSESVTTYEYEYDDLQRPIRITRKTDNSTKPWTYTITYQE